MGMGRGVVGDKVLLSVGIHGILISVIGEGLF